MALINIYAATEGKEEEIKEQFYEELHRTQDRVPKQDVVIIMGNMNAKLGKEKVFSQVIDRHNLYNISNENGEIVANYAISNGMFLISTNFQHKKIHIGTWTSPEGRQHRRCIIPQAVTLSLVLLKMGKIIARNMLS